MATLFCPGSAEIYDGIVRSRRWPATPFARQDGVISRDSSVIRSAPASACAVRACSPCQRAAVREDRHHSVVRPTIATFVLRAGPAEVRQVVTTRTASALRRSVVPYTTTTFLLADRPCADRRSPRLALTGWDIDILTGRGIRAPPAAFRNSDPCFMEALMSTMWSGQLCFEGFTSWSEPAAGGCQELAGIEGFDEDTATRIAGPRQGISRALMRSRDQSPGTWCHEDAVKTVPA